MKLKLFSIPLLLLLLTVSTGCNNKLKDSNANQAQDGSGNSPQGTAIFGKEIGEVENCDDLVFYFTNSEMDISFYTKCVKGISVTYSDSKLYDSLKDALHNKRISLEQMKESAKASESMDNRTIYKYIDFNMSVCKENKNVIFTVSSDMNDYCS